MSELNITNVDFDSHGDVTMNVNGFDVSCEVGVCGEGIMTVAERDNVVVRVVTPRDANAKGGVQPTEVALGLYALSRNFPVLSEVPEAAVAQAFASAS